MQTHIESTTHNIIIIMHNIELYIANAAYNIRTQSLNAQRAVFFHSSPSAQNMRTCPWGSKINHLEKLNLQARTHACRKPNSPYFSTSIAKQRSYKKKTTERKQNAPKPGRNGRDGLAKRIYVPIHIIKQTVLRGNIC